MKPLYFLPFDHRSGFDSALLGYPYPPKTAGQRRKVSAMKQIVYEAFLEAYRIVSPKIRPALHILVDEEFGTPILRDAKKRGIPFALTVEASGQEEFDFAQGRAFGQHILTWKPTYAKVLVRYDAAKDNQVQLKRLKRLSTFCRAYHIPLLFEMLLTGSGSRFAQMQKAIPKIRRAGIHVDLWKLEGLDTAAEWDRIHRLTGTAEIVVLGRAGSAAEVRHWLKAAAESGVVNGFAVGRTIFFRPLEAYRDGKADRRKTIERIAKQFLGDIKFFENHL